MNTVICLIGPTASGKSSLVNQISNLWPVEIINMDSATIYRSMNIGTAKPSKEEMKKVKYHLIDIIEPYEMYSVANFCKDAKFLINNILERNKIPIIVGGTMMYYNALKNGLNDLPKSDAKIRLILEEEIEKNGLLSVYKKLHKIDPKIANKINPNDSQRIKRALEVFLITGKKMSSIIEISSIKENLKEDYKTISLEPSIKSILHKKIEIRLEKMFERGFINEVTQLYQNEKINSNLPSMKCVGYRQIWSYLDNKINLEVAKREIFLATKNLAKRQMTWLRSYQNKNIIDCTSENMKEEVIKTMSNIINLNKLNKIIL